jgi:hypothetical protein
LEGAPEIRPINIESDKDLNQRADDEILHFENPTPDQTPMANEKVSKFKDDSQLSKILDVDAIKETKSEHDDRESIDKGQVKTE